MKPAPKGLSVRWMGVRDFSYVAEVEKSTFGARSAFSLGDIREFSRNPEFFGVVALLDGIQVGHVLYETTYSRSGSVTKIYSVAVDVLHRRMGIGTCMIEFMRKRPDGELKSRRIDCDVTDANLAAHLWLKSCGFIAVGIRRQDFRDGCYCVYEFQWSQSAVSSCKEQ